MDFMLLHPTRYLYITQGYKLPHEGLDIRGRLDELVCACFDGVVRIATKAATGYGIHVSLTHNLPDGRIFETIYGHFSKLECTQGDIVRAGQAIGRVGNTGHSTGAHLHLTLKEHQVLPTNYDANKDYLKNVIDPTPFLQPPDVFFRDYCALPITVPVGIRGVVQVKVLHIRKAPATNQAILASARQGETLLLTDERVKSGGYTWGQLAPQQVAGVNVAGAWCALSQDNEIYVAVQV